jgi:hypothetical protein
MQKYVEVDAGSFARLHDGTFTDAWSQMRTAPASGRRGATHADRHRGAPDQVGWHGWLSVWDLYLVVTVAASTPLRAALSPAKSADSSRRPPC